jgi:hypothetical protein
MTSHNRCLQAQVQLPRADLVPQQGIIRKAAHVHRPFNRLALAVQRQRAVGLARHRHDAEIDLRRIGLVDLKLPAANLLAPVQRGKIHVAELHRLLDLPRLATGQKHQRTMRLDHPDRLAGQPICRTIRQEVDNLTLLRHPVFSAAFAPDSTSHLAPAFSSRFVMDQPGRPESGLHIQLLEYERTLPCLQT